MERWQASLNEKAAIEAEAKAAALEAAKADLETHVVERAANKEAKMGRNREQEQVGRDPAGTAGGGGGGKVTAALEAALPRMFQSSALPGWRSSTT